MQISMGMLILYHFVPKGLQLTSPDAGGGRAVISWEVTSRDTSHYVSMALATHQDPSSFYINSQS